MENNEIMTNEVMDQNENMEIDAQNDEMSAKGAAVLGGLVVVGAYLLYKGVKKGVQFIKDKKGSKKKINKNSDDSVVDVDDDDISEVDD